MPYMHCWVQHDMTLQELYDYITSQLTPEEALKKMLEAGLLKYEKLKFNEGEEIHPIQLIAMASMDMGWKIAIEKDQENIRGISIGSEEYMLELFGK